MNPTIVALTVRQLVGRRRIVLLAGIGVLMVLVALVYRIGDPTDAAAAEWTTQLLTELGVRTMLPIVALIIGTSAFGAEIDEGTILYLLAKPVARHEIVLSKLAAAMVLTGLLTAPASVLAALVAGGSQGGSLAAGFAIGMAAGSAIYTAIFMALGLVTTRAFIVGLGYIIIWEALLAGLFAGTRTFSVRQHVLALTDATVPIARVVGDVLDPTTALVVGGGAFVLATAVAIRALGGFEIRGEAA